MNITTSNIVNDAEGQSEGNFSSNVSPADEKRKRNAESGKQDTQATDLPISYDDESEKESRKSQSSRKSSDSEDRHKKSSHKTDKSREERFKFVCF